jgi:hypothetical protein
VVEFKQASQPFTGADLTRSFSNPIGGRRKQNYIVIALVISFAVKMRNVLAERIPQGAFAKENELRETLLLHGTVPPFQMRIEVWAVRRQLYGLDARRLQDGIESGTEFGIPIVQEKTAPI